MASYSNTKDLSQIVSKQVFFYDDHFTANKKGSKELLRRIIDERGKTHQVRDLYMSLSALNP